MKVFAAVLILSAIVAYASALAIPEVIDAVLTPEDEGKKVNLEDVDTDGGLSTSTELSPIRQARVTCDILSISTPWGAVNHAACAARCLAQNHKGGACTDGVCHCRD